MNEDEFIESRSKTFFVREAKVSFLPAIASMAYPRIAKATFEYAGAASGR